MHRMEWKVHIMIHLVELMIYLIVQIVKIVVRICCVAKLLLLGLKIFRILIILGIVF
jgi:hypothetical protein